MALVLTSPAFPPNQPIPTAFTGEGGNRSPPLHWRGVPVGTSAFVLMCDDPDAPRGTFTHWLLYDIPEALEGLPEDLPAIGEPAGCGRHGRNDFGGLGWGGPMPPVGERHRYRFSLFALDRRLYLPVGVMRTELEREIEAHVIERTRLIGTYQRHLAFVPG